MPTDHQTATAARSLALNTHHAALGEDLQPAPSMTAGPDSAYAPGMATSPSGRRISALSGRQKAAILVRLLLDEGADVQLSHLPEEQQTALTEEIARMRLVDRETVSTVANEFVETLEQIALSFSGGIEGALDALGSRLSPEAAERLRQRARALGRANPWERIASAEADELIGLLAAEADEVAAVVLSKLPVSRAAGLLGLMPGERARRIAFAMPLTETIAPSAVARIGTAMARQLDERPRPAFPATPGERFGAILNETGTRMRESLLAELHDRDEQFAESVRRNIFTFGLLHERLNPRDVPKSLRDVGQDVLITALGAALQNPESAEAASAEFLLGNMSQRLSTALQDEIETRGRIKAREGEAAQTAVIANIRALLDTGEITLLTPDNED